MNVSSMLYLLFAVCCLLFVDALPLNSQTKNTDPSISSVFLFSLLLFVVVVVLLFLFPRIQVFTPFQTDGLLW